MRFLRYVGRARPAEAAYKAGLDGDQFVILDPWSNTDSNISSYFRLDGKYVMVPLRAHARDLFDLAAMVYVGDEIVPRATASDQWTRELEFTLPVFDRTKWEAVESALATCLGFLSGERDRFGWLDRPTPRRLGPFISTNSAADTTLCAFSRAV